MSSKRYILYHIEKYTSFMGGFLTSLHRRILPIRGTISILISLFLYVNIILLFGNFLESSSNFFVLIPLITASFADGLIGGLAAGLLAVPMNLLLFRLIGHPEYVPPNIIVTESAAILIGFVMGNISDFLYMLKQEMEKRRLTEEQLRKTLEDKELLLRELNHRVRNNLSIITSLIQLQMSRTEDSLFKEEMQKLNQRIFSISLVHEQLYQDGHSVFLDVREYLDTLLENLATGAWGPSVRLKTEWPEAELLLVSDKVIYLGLIVHEVVTNCVKYAFRGIESPRLIVKLKQEGEALRLLIRDNGRGFNPAAVKSGLGMKLIHSLCAQVDGEYLFTQDGGMIFDLQFSVI